MHFNRILQKDAVNEAEKRITTAFRLVMGKENDCILSSQEIVKAVEIVERRTRKQKGTCVLKFNDVSIPENTTAQK